ncbi:aminotransferase class IV [Nocardia sp. NPDC050412]|uniref:aminotransferase class IV n=1 Tax=Nocardia sp. NPDC050412 TaxID=3364320 RepID=UPI0037B9FE03
MSGLTTAGRVGAVWMDGALVDPAAAHLPVLSFGLHNAACVFEGIRSFGGRPFALSAHVNRLRTSAEAIGIALPWDSTAIADAIETAVAAADFAEAYIRPVVWRGDEVIGIDPTGTTVHLAIAVLAWPKQALDDGKPLRLGLSRWTRPTPTMAPVQAKTSANYLVGSLALAEARAGGFDDALLLDHTGGIAETTGSNIFLVRRGELVTPPAHTFLNGITRQTVLRLAARSGIVTREIRLTPNDLVIADEVFVTGTAVGVRSVGWFRDTAFRADGILTRMLANAYIQLVGTEQGEESPCTASA